MKMTKHSPGHSVRNAPSYQELAAAKRRAVRSGPELAELRVRLGPQAASAAGRSFAASYAQKLEHGHDN